MRALEALKRIGERETSEIRYAGAIPAVYDIKDCADYEIVESELKAMAALSDRFGIDAKILLTALSVGIFYKTPGGQIVWEVPTLYCMSICPIPVPGQKIEWCWATKERFLPFNEYGKSWAVTKEELEEKNEISCRESNILQ